MKGTTLLAVATAMLMANVAHAEYAAMDEIPVTGGELRLARPRAIEIEGNAGGELTITADAQVVAFPLEHTKVSVDIAGPMASVTVEHRFANRFTEPIEGVYVFPLGADAAVHDYEIVIGERVVRGVIQKASEARAGYETARSQGKTAALLEQQKPNVFVQSVANIPPDEEMVIVRFRYVELLTRDDDTWELAYPMVVAPRYLPEHTSDPRPVSGQPIGAKPRPGAVSPG